MSIKKIAQMTGCSPATVSRVLNNPDYKCSKPGMREKIWKAAMDTNYTPNEAARNLKKGQTTGQNNYYIDVLMTRMDGYHADPFFQELLRVVESQIHKNSCILSRIWYKSIFSDDKKCQQERIENVFREMFQEQDENRDGLIIIGRCNSRVIRQLKKYYKNIVSINRNSTNYEIDEVLCDGEKIASMAVGHLSKLGHRKIGYVGKCHGEARFRGFSETLLRNHLELYPEYIIETSQTEREGFEAMKQFMTLEDPPTAVYCANDITAVGMLKCAAQFKSSRYLPSIISSDDIEEGQFTNPMLSTVHLPKKNMARFAMALLLDRIRGGHSEVVRMELEGRLMLRESCFSLNEMNQPEYCI